MSTNEPDGAELAPATATVRTTRTAQGRLVDWVPVESQVPDGVIATPPPATTDEEADEEKVAASMGPATMAELGRASFEEHDPDQRGPEGTVPLLRERPEHRRRVEARGADKVAPVRRPKRAGAGEPTAETADPDPFGYYHATTAESGTFYGCSGSIGVYDPYVQYYYDHSLMQCGLLNFDNPHMQSLEAGWTVDQSLNGDTIAHVFTYFTTNGYTGDGNDIGGYNRLHRGWVQYDANVFPGIRINGASVIGGGQLEVSMKFQLWQGNWWFQLQGIWLGYYPASLFGAGALSQKAEWAGFWGEVYSQLGDPTQTIDQMGSGELAESGWPNACFENNLLVQTDPGGGMSGFNGSPSAENSAYYDINQSMLSGSSWGSYFFAGGSGHGTPPGH